MFPPIVATSQEHFVPTSSSSSDLATFRLGPHLTSWTTFDQFGPIRFLTSWGSR